MLNIKDRMTEEQLKDTMLLLKRVKEELSPRNEYICRRMVLAAACLGDLDGLRSYSWFLEQFKHWIKDWMREKPKLINDFFHIGFRAANNDTFYRIKARTVLYGDNGDFEKELHKVWEDAVENSKCPFPF